ncbi:hypothetical protein GCM10027199_43230 [Amycolatopsis magusensis]
MVPLRPISTRSPPRVSHDFRMVNDAREPGPRGDRPKVSAAATSVSDPPATSRSLGRFAA